MNGYVYGQVHKQLWRQVGRNTTHGMCVCVCVCVCARARARERACVSACVRARSCRCEYVRLGVVLLVQMGF